MSKLLFLSSLGPRLPVVVSLVAHAAIAVAASGGHGHGAAPAHADEVTIDIDTTTPPPRAEEPAPAPPPHVDPPVTYATHTHPYPLPPGHDDHPHDPSIDHRHAADAPAVIVAPDSALPHFSIVLGPSPVTAAIGRTVGAAGQGLGNATTAPVGETESEEPNVSVPARLLSSGRPEYPAAARAAGIEADVPLEIVVDSGGRVVESRLVSRAGHGFDEAALTAIRTYRFAPAQRDGAPVRARMRWTVSFRME